MAIPRPPLPALTASLRRLGGGSRRFVLLGGVLALGIGLWAVGRWATGPTYVTLHRDLELGTVASVTEALAKHGIPYRLESGGTEVLVPVRDVARARVLLAKDGLPGSGRPGMELFDQPTWGMTDFTQRITYRRALEGELARTIGSLEGVQRAQVHLALPENSPLRKLERPAEAAVVVTLRPGRTLAPDAVQGIAYLVSNSVEGLTPQRVAVLDAAGRVLSAPDGDGIGLSSRQLELQRGVERELGERIERFMATVLGAGHTRAQVSATLDFAQVERTIEAYDPDGQVLTTEQRSETDGDGETGGQTIVHNAYANSRRVERIIGSTGTVQRLTVAVLVDARALAATGVQGAGVDSALRRFDAALWNAIGLDSARGDRLTIAAMPFEVDSVPLVPAAAPATNGDLRGLLGPYALPVAAGLGLLLAGAAATVALRRRRRRTAPAIPAALPTSPAPEPTGAPAAAPSTAGREPALPAGSQQLRERVRADSAAEPAVIAQVLRAWLAEPRA